MRGYIDWRLSCKMHLFGHAQWALVKCINHDYVIKWKHFPRHWSFVRGIHRSPVIVTIFPLFPTLILSSCTSYPNGPEAGREAGWGFPLPTAGSGVPGVIVQDTTHMYVHAPFVVYVDLLLIKKLANYATFKFHFYKWNTRNRCWYALATILCNEFENYPHFPGAFN